MKGRSFILVRDGELKKQTMQRQQVSLQDLEEDMRLSAEIDDLHKVKIARLEVSGDVSFIPREKNG